MVGLADRISELEAESREARRERDRLLRLIDTFVTRHDRGDVRVEEQIAALRNAVQAGGR